MKMVSDVVFLIRAATGVKANHKEHMDTLTIYPGVVF